MQRIPNPVSDLDIILRVYREIYEVLGQHRSFGLDDISKAMISRNNVTSQGAIGKEALLRSTREDRSRDPIYNQSKMYAEIFRTFGWMQSTSSKLTYEFSLLGEYVALAKNPAAILKECLLGIAYPNEVLGVQSEQTVRVIAGIVLAMDGLGTITRDEVMAGPMSIADDSDPKAFKQMVLEIADCRKTAGALNTRIDEISRRRKISRSPTMENYTRIPMASLLWSGWGEKIGRKAIHITDAGRLTAKRLRLSADYRLNSFNALSDEIKPSFIRWTFYSMLRRAGFNLDPVMELFEFSKKELESHNISTKQDIFFSPFQQLSQDTLAKWVPELIRDFKDGSFVDDLGHVPALAPAAERERPKLIFSITDQDIEASGTFANLKNQIQEMLAISGNIDDAVSMLFKKFSGENKDIFYPLVANLFSVLGLDCRVSRGGQNYERADAIILDKEKSIPIEIKSPGEETEISVKGVRQALENKIIFLSRKSYPTDRETTSLVVGFNPPNDRSEVHELIDDIWNAFDIRVGVVDFRSLLMMAVSAISSGKKIDIKNLGLLKGVISV
ncbi:hypothetical protein ICN46_00085 [Polynucleobacter sp. Latsch14-2]|uniref:hypothetical protein n=1 Tax=Polynucleobacter sp. Latsch14-2 TaxID=2576920 RepID=UPI001C0B24D6|nr:hypothetical protein [Polynucleobacter sp. Latsch14-2]MBU3613293.1 hypothetical protein [Polynucleobacter sp. Latsch14-2]